MFHNQRTGMLQAAMVFVCGLSVLSAQAPMLVIPDGTPIRLRLARNISSADAKEGETVDFEVLEDVSVNDVVVVKRGGVAMATVTQAQAKRRMGRAGKLDINIDHTRMIGGEKIALRAVKAGSGGSNAGKMTGAIVATSLIFFPAAPLFLFAKGKDINIPKGTELTAYTNGETKVEGAKFLASPSAATVPVVPAAATQSKPLTNADVLALKVAGFSDSLIIAKIAASPSAFKTEPAELIELRNKGIGDAVIEQMLKGGAPQK